MSYQRALWHSGLTYRVYCAACGTFTVYTDYHLGYRAWFPDGFVYCAKCRRPTRHNENNAIKEDGTPYFPFPIRTPPPPGYVAYPIETLAIQQPYSQYQQPVQQPMQPGQPVQQPVQQPMQQQPIQQPVQQQPVAQPSAPTDTESASEKAKCPNCGFEYTAGEQRFCTRCGTKLIE